MNEIGKQWCLAKIDYIVPGAKPDYVIMQNDQINQLFAGLMMKDGQPVEYSTNDPHVHFAAQVVEQIEAPDAEMFRLKSAMYPETTFYSPSFEALSIVAGENLKVYKVREKLKKTGKLVSSSKIYWFEVPDGAMYFTASGKAPHVKHGINSYID